MQTNILSVVISLLFLSTQAQLVRDSRIVIANQSGAFDAINTWNDKVKPETNSTVIIPRGITVYINDETNLNVNVQSIRIHGKLQIGSSKISFRFSNRINLMVFDGGMLEVLTSNHTWFVLPNSIITIYKNALLNSAQSTKFVSNSNSSYQALSSTINGPFTITVDLQGVIQNYSAITFVPSESGDFGLNSTWLGGLSPTLDRCSPTFGGCVLIVPAGFSVSRHHNQSTLNAVDVHIYGSFEIVSLGSYSFLYPMSFYIYNGGIFQDSTENGFRLFINTSINVLTGGTFITRPSNSIYSYNDKNSTLSSAKLNKTNIPGPYRMYIDMSGNIYDNGSLSPTPTTTTTTTVTGNTLTCYSCTDCGDPFKSGNVATVTVPANQGYYCRKSSLLNIVDRDVSQWCVQDNVNGNGLWCCQSNLCNHAKTITSTTFLVFSFALILLSKLF